MMDLSTLPALLQEWHVPGRKLLFRTIRVDPFRLHQVYEVRHREYAHLASHIEDIIVCDVTSAPTIQFPPEYQPLEVFNRFLLALP